MIIRNLKTVFLSLISIIILQGCKSNVEKNETAIRNVILVETETTGESLTKKYAGVLEEGKSVNAAFMTAGKVSTLNIKEGDRVRQGQLIATLDDSDYQIGVNQLKVQYDQMSSEKKRMDEMFARHNLAPNDYEKFQAGFEQLALQLEMAKNKLGYTKLYSPTDGFVSHKFLQPGELVDAGTPIYKITDDSNLVVCVDLPLSVYLNKKEIERAYGILPHISQEIPLNIESFTPDADNNQLYHMKLNIPASFKKELTPGMNITVVLDINNEVRGETLIPSRSIFNYNGLSYVWVFNDVDSTLSKKKVNVIGQPKNEKSIVNGLIGEEKIVEVGVKQLEEGEKVNVIAVHSKTK